MRTLILGIGNPIMSDDAAGVVAAERLAGRVPAEIRTGAASGLGVLDQLVGYERAIILDATQTQRDAPGTIRCHEPEPGASATGPAGAHHARLDRLLAWGRGAWPELPPRLVVYTIEAADLSTIGEGLSPAVERGVAQLVEQVVRDHFTTADADARQGPADG